MKWSRTDLPRTAVRRDLLQSLGAFPRTIAASQRLYLRVWDSDDLLENVLATYPLLDYAIRAELPLKQVWVLAEEFG